MFFLFHPSILSAKPKAKPRIEVKELKLKEVVIKKKDETLLSDSKKSMLPEVLISSVKQEPEISLKDEIKEKSKVDEKKLPGEVDPGCMYSNACVSIFSKTVKGDEGYYSSAIAAYLRGEYTTAYKLFSDLTKKFPKGKYAPDAYYWIAEINYKQYERPAEADRYFKYVVERYKGSRYEDYANYSLAHMYFGNGRYKKTKGYADAAFDAKPAGEVAEESLMMSLLSSYNLKEYDDCIKKGEKVLKLFSETKYADLVTNIRGNAFFLTGEYEKAKKEFSGFTKEFKDSEHEPNVLYGLGLSYFQLGLHADSIKPNEELIKKYPDFKFIDTVMFRLIQAYSETDQLDKAVSMLTKLEDTAPKSPHIKSGHYEVAYRYFLTGEYETARERFLLFIDKFPKSPFKGAEYFLLAGSEMHLSRNADAITHYTEFLKINNDEELVKEAMLNSGYAYYFDDLSKEAIHALEKVLSRYGTGIEKVNEIWYFLGESYFRISDFKRSAKSFSQVDPENDYYNLSVLGLGWVKFAENDFQGAIELFLKYLSSGAKEFLPETYLVLSKSYFNIKDFDNAITNLQKIKDDYPKSDVVGKTNYLMGLIDFKKGEYDKSVELLKAALTGDKEKEYMDDSLYWLGWSYFQLEEYDKAAKEFTNLVSEYPGSTFTPKAILKIGDCYFNLKRYTSAALSYKSIIEKEPGSKAAAAAEYGIIQSLFSQKNFEEFEASSREYVKKYPEHELGAIIYLQLAEYYSEKGDHTNAATVYEDLAKLYPESDTADDALYKSGRILLDAGKSDEALKNFVKVTKDYPDSNLINENNYNLANAYFDVGRFKDAIKYYDITAKNMEKTDTAKESLKKASEAYLNLNNYEMAAKELIAAAEMFNEDPFDRKTYIKVGDIYFKNKVYNKAVPYYQKALDSRFKGVGVSAQAKIAEAYYKQKDFETALLEYLKIIYLHKSEKDYVDDAYFKIGELYLTMGKKEEAKKIYIKLQDESLDPDKIGIAIEKLKELGVNNE
jgi:TolA-binding protein